MLEAEVAPARRPWRIVVVLAVPVVIATIVTIMLTREEMVPLVLPAPVATPPAPREPRIDQPIEYIAAASDAPVIAVASARHVWISRDDGKTFRRALEDASGELYGISIEPTGRVYAMYGENKKWRSPGGGGVDTIEMVFGIADVDGRERWRPANEMLAAPIDVRAGTLVGTQSTVIGHDAGESWSKPSSSWHVWRSAIDEHPTVRYFASRRDKPDACEDCGRGFALLVAREGGRLDPVWTMLDHTDLYTDDWPYSLLACAGFAGSTLYLAARDHDKTTLMVIGGDGKVLRREALGAAESCTIAGNDRAAYMALGADMIRIDTGEQRVAPAGSLTPRGANDRDELAVDEHGFLLYVADGCVWRYTESGSGNPRSVICGPHR